MQIQTTQALFDQYLAKFESKLSQNSPLNDKAFLVVLAGLQALVHTGQYKFGANQIKQVLALTAKEAGLELLGQEFNLPRKQAEAAVLEISVSGTNGVTIPATRFFVGESNGVIYYPDASATISSGTASLTVTAETSGVIGNLNIGDSLSISSQVSGASSTATVTAIITTGADKEALETYRARVLSVERGATGGGNAYDHKIWAEEPAGVKRAFPYSGKPYGSAETSYPGDRTIYVECQAALDPDGIPDTALLDEVRDSINTNANTGYDRPPLGLTDDTLYIEAISRQAFYVTASGLAIQTDLETQAKADVDTALDTYFSSLAPFVVGIDFQEDRREVVTAITVAEIVQNVLTSYGGSCESVTVSLTSGGAAVISFTLNPGVLAKLGEDTTWSE